MSEELRTELDRVKREAAAMRDTLVWLHAGSICADPATAATSRKDCPICKALSTTAGSDYVSKAEARPVAEELRYWAEGPKHTGDCEFSDKSDEGCWLCMKADRERWPQTSTVMSTARKLGLLEDKQ